jgi:hypothetical protein
MTNKQVQTVEDDNEESEEVVGLTLPLTLPKADLSPTEMLRLQLLILSKDILMGKAAMKWETHKQYGDVTVDEIIAQAQNMFEFVRDEEECE